MTQIELDSLSGGNNRHIVGKSKHSSGFVAQMARSSRVGLKVELLQTSKARVLLSPGLLTWDVVAGLAELAAKKNGQKRLRTLLNYDAFYHTKKRQVRIVNAGTW